MTRKDGQFGHVSTHGLYDCTEPAEGFLVLYNCILTSGCRSSGGAIMMAGGRAD